MTKETCPTNYRVLEFLGLPFKVKVELFGQKTMFVRTAGCDYHLRTGATPPLLGMVLKNQLA